MVPYQYYANVYLHTTYDDPDRYSYENLHFIIQGSDFAYCLKINKNLVFSFVYVKTTEFEFGLMKRKCLNSYTKWNV